MTYPTLNEYIESIDNININTSLSLTPLRDTREAHHPPLYRITKGSVYFAVIDANQQQYNLIVFLNDSAKNRFLELHNTSKLTINKLFIPHTNDDGYWCEAIITPHTKNSFFTEITNNNQRDITEGLRPFLTGDKWGFEDKNGIIVIVATWDYVDDFCEGRSIVQQNGFYGLIDTQGTIIVETLYNELSWYGSQFVYAEIDGYWGVIDRCGTKVIDFEWDWISSFENGYTLVEKSGKYGFIDDKGTIIIEPKYDKATKFNEHGYSHVTLNNSSFFIDIKERRV